MSPGASVAVCPSMWLAAPLSSEVTRAVERIARAGDVRHVAVMPDVHLASEVCIGLVVATSARLYPSAVGGDIGCGMSAVAFEADADLLTSERNAERLLAAIEGVIPTNRRPVAQVLALPQNLDEKPLSAPSLEKLKQREGRPQFATLGGGNHFLELQRDPDGRLWLMLHSGSRAMGKAIRDHHLRAGKTDTQGGGAKQPLYLDADSLDGKAYLADLGWALAYAKASRRRMVDLFSELMGSLFGVSAMEETFIDCHHNEVRQEHHFGEPMWVHRKGAISAQPDELGIIPGSMGTSSYHVRGRGAEASLCSSSHGAGRCMSRADAFREITVRAFERDVRGIWFDRRLTSKLRDEAPSAYKDIRQVMAAQRELTAVVRRLEPVLCYKGVT